ncbi:Uncharacterised protein [Vibrio cholerae]|nr:Uncharacterised protein [Vibrio cholerae]
MRSESTKFFGQPKETKPILLPVVWLFWLCSAMVFFAVSSVVV